MSNFGTQQNLLHLDKETESIVNFLCSESNKLSNCAIYEYRQRLINFKQSISKFDLVKQLKNCPHNKTLYSQTSQQTIISVSESFVSYFKLKRIKDLHFDPKMPNYKKNGLKTISYTKQSVKLIGGKLEFPLGNKVKSWFGISKFTLDMPTNIDFNKIRELRILPRNGQFYLELIYKLEKKDLILDKNKVLGIDSGVDNWLTCVSNVGHSFILCGRESKAYNQFHNKQISEIKSKNGNVFSRLCKQLTERRNRYFRDLINKRAKQVIDFCINNNIGTVVVGWNKMIKDSSKMSKKVNQSFVQIPTSRLINRIKELCEQHNISFIMTEESYTSQSSFLDNDELPVFGTEGAERVKFSGKRVKRGLYKTQNKLLVNADCNGAANILRKVMSFVQFNKVSTNSRLCLDRVSRSQLTWLCRFVRTNTKIY